MSGRGGSDALSRVEEKRRASSSDGRDPCAAHVAAGLSQKAQNLAMVLRRCPALPGVSASDRGSGLLRLDLW